MKRLCDETSFYVGGDEQCQIKAVLADTEEGMDELMDSIDMTIDWPDVLLDRLREALCELKGPIGLLVKVDVDESLRGQGRGGALVNEYLKEIGSKSQVDILFARVDNEQATGIDLRSFYQSRGFESVSKCSGSLLMVNKGYRAHILERIWPHRANKLEDSGIEP